MIMMNKVPLVIHEKYIYPSLTLIEMIRLTNAYPKLQSITRKMFVKEGSNLGYKDIVYPKDLLKILEWKKDLYQEFNRLIKYISEEVFCFLSVWLYDHFENNEIKEELTEKFYEKRKRIEKKIYHLLEASFQSFKEDLERCLEKYNGKLIWKYETYKKHLSNQDKVLKCIFWSFELEIMNTVKTYLFKYSIDVFAESGSDLESLDLHPIIKGNLSYNINRKLYQMIYQ